MFRFGIKHALVAITAIAILFASLNFFGREVVTIEFNQVSLRTKENHGDLWGDGDYVAHFTAIDSSNCKLDGSAFGKFGYNAFLDLEIDTENIMEIQGQVIELTLVRRPFPWSPKPSIADQLIEHFVNVSGRTDSEDRNIWDRSRHH